MAEPTEHGTPQPVPAQRSAGLAFVVLAAASAALLLFIPLMMLGYTIYVLLAVVNGVGLAWQSSVAMSYAFGGPLALLSLVLLVIPYRLFRAAGRRIGARQAVLWVGGLLAVWLVGVAAVWAWDSTSGFTGVAVRDALWYPVAFGVAAVIATFIVHRRAALVPVAFVGLLALVLSGTVRGQASIPFGAQEVHVVVTASEVRLDAVTVHAGDVYLVLDTPRSSVSFAQDALGPTEMPFQGSFDLLGCSDAQRAQDLGQIGPCGNVFKVTLPAGLYVLLGAIGEGPLSPPVHLEVVP